MRRVLLVLCLSLLYCGSISAQEKSAPTTKPKSTEAANEARESANPTAAKLPVRRVVLYKNGVGYFEHLGRVRGSQDVHVDFTSAQLNDVLKSLTVLDLSGGRITGVDYNSEAPLARRLATLRLSLGERPTTAEFLGALRGARLEVRSGNGLQLAGKLLSVERKTRTGAGPGWTVETDEISLITDSGEVRTVDLNASTSVRIAEKDLQVEVGRYLGLIASSRDQDVRRMTATSAKSRYGRRLTALSCRQRQTRSLCFKAGPSWTTPWARIGTAWNSRSWRERRIRSFNNSRNHFTGGAR